MTREEFVENLKELSKERLIELLLQQWEELSILKDTLDLKIMLQ